MKRLAKTSLSKQRALGEGHSHFPSRERSSRQRQQQKQRPEGSTVPSMPEEQGGGQQEKNERPEQGETQLSKA